MGEPVGGGALKTPGHSVMTQPDPICLCVPDREKELFNHGFKIGRVLHYKVFLSNIQVVGVNNLYKIGLPLNYVCTFFFQYTPFYVFLGKQKMWENFAVSFLVFAYYVFVL